MTPDCLGQRFGHNYAGGKCLKCGGLQNPPKKISIEPIRKENKSGSARAYLISQFLEELNKTRDGVKYKKLTPRALGVKLAHIKKMEDLRWFWDECRHAKNFSKFFWYKLKK